MRLTPEQRELLAGVPHDGSTVGNVTCARGSAGAMRATFLFATPWSTPTCSPSAVAREDLCDEWS